MGNYLAIIVASVAAMAIGAWWYSPKAFGKQWMKLEGFKKKDMKKMKLSPAQAMAGGFIATLVTAYVLDMFIPGNWMDGAKTGLWAWLGFIATTQIGAVLWQNKKMKLFFLNTACSFVMMAVMGAILGAL